MWNSFWNQFADTFKCPVPITCYEARKGPARVFCETQPPASIGWVALSSLFVRCLSRIGNTSSHLHYMMFQTIQTIYFLWGYDPGNLSVSFIAELSPVYCCLVFVFFATNFLRPNPIPSKKGKVSKLKCHTLLCSKGQRVKSIKIFSFLEVFSSFGGWNGKLTILTCVVKFFLSTKFSS